VSSVSDQMNKVFYYGDLLLEPQGNVKKSSCSASHLEKMPLMGHFSFKHTKRHTNKSSLGIFIFLIANERINL
jgi:hypothetical protein